MNRNEKFVITINRELGSGGRSVGKKLAERLGDSTEMLKTFEGAVIKKHHPILDDLGKKEFDTLKDYIEELMKN